MSNPKIKFNSGMFLHKSIFKTEYPDKKLDNYIIEFENFYRKKESIVLKIISDVTGLKWKMKQIDVYFFDADFPSVSFPLCLNYNGGNKEFSLFCIIHELAHDIIFYNWSELFDNKNISPVELEALCEFVAKKVCENIFDKATVLRLAKSHEFSGYYRCVWDREKELEKIIGHETLLQFYKKENIKW